MDNRKYLYQELERVQQVERTITTNLSLLEARDALRHADDKLCRALGEPTRGELLAKEREMIGGPKLMDPNQAVGVGQRDRAVRDS